MQNGYDAYRNRMQKIADVNHSIAVLGWDKEVMLPRDGARFRSQQVATLSAIAHELSTNESLGNLLNELKKEETLSEDQKRNVALSILDYEKATKLSEAFVVEMSKTTSKAYHSWIAARKKDDYSIFEPFLDSLITLCREECELLGYKDHPYNAQLDKYEPGMTVDQLESIFKPLRDQLKILTGKLSANQQIEASFLKQKYNKEDQWDFGLEVLREMNYDFNKGRQDISTHPFTTSFSPEDVRITTRIDENDMSNMLWSCIHEGGHALYEQGLSIDNYGLPLGSAVSLGIHESQSRLWENHVGRSLSFWEHFYPKLQQKFSKQLEGISLSKFYKAINKISPNLIRTEADELHYHLHVIIRYEIEKELMEGNLSAADLPALWNKKYHDYLGIEAKSFNNGILQDIHWSHGSFGYFPTYSLGSLYSAQFYNQAQIEMPDLDDQFRAGDFSQLLTWLRKNVHQFGRKYDAAELCQKITGESLNSKYFLEYASSKFSDVYGIV